MIYKRGRHEARRERVLMRVEILIDAWMTRYYLVLSTKIRVRLICRCSEHSPCDVVMGNLLNLRVTSSAWMHHSNDI